MDTKRMVTIIPADNHPNDNILIEGNYFLKKSYY